MHCSIGCVYITVNMNITYWLLRCGGNTCKR